MADPAGFSLTRLPLSGWVLIAANFLPLVGVFAFDWQVLPIMLLFWAENVVIGLVQVLRMAFAGSDHGAKLGLIPFFIVHYGLFTVAHGAVILSLFGGPAGAAADPASVVGIAASVFTADRALALAFAGLLVSHLFSFGNNYLSKGLYRQSSPRSLLSEPYGRVIIMHVTVLCGGLAAQQFGSPVWALLVLIGLKTIFDLRAHLAQNQGGSDDRRAAVGNR